MDDTLTNDPYVVLVDVIGSRDIHDRQAFRTRLVHALESANRTHTDAIVVPFETIKGIDEFGAVFDRLSPLPAIIEAILNAIHPTRLRIVVTSGEIDTGDPVEGIATLDGPAFHRADDLIRDVEADDLYVGIDTRSPWDGLLASALNLLVMAREDRTARQVEIVRTYERYTTQTRAAAELELTPQAISKTLQRIDYHRLLTLRERIRRTCEELYD